MKMTQLQILEDEQLKLYEKITPNEEGSRLLFFLLKLSVKSI